ncbi:trypsin-like serine protease [Salinispora sp. H7-4]|nr:trypsin-like serine protease [Salinispora sp. H7-4]
MSGGSASAVAGSDPVPDGAHSFTAKITFGDISACSGALIAPNWVVTAKSCFVEGGAPVAAGVPTQPTTVVVGRTDLTAPTGHETQAVSIVPHPDRNLALVRISRPMVDIPAIPITAAEPASAETLTVSGYGRTATEWVPNRLHAAPFTVQEIDPELISIDGATADATICKGDAGGPVFRENDGDPQLVAINNTSWQKGCLGETATQDGATGTRVDDLADWIQENTPAGCNAAGWTTTDTQVSQVVQFGDYTGDCISDLINQNPGGTLRGWHGTGDLSADNRLFVGSDVAVGSGWSTSLAPRIITGDFNGDGRTDLIHQNAVGHLRIFPSTSDLTADNKLFTDSYIVGSGWTTTAFPRIITGDFNGDGRTDLMRQNAAGYLRIFPSTGDLTADNKLFTDSYIVGSGWTTSLAPRIITGDFNGDGRTDLIHQNAVGHLRIFPSTSDLTADNKLFTDSYIVGSGWTTSLVPRIITGDFNGDGRTDLIHQNAAGYLTAFPNTGDLTADKKLFTDSYAVGSGWTTSLAPRIITGDFNGDGRTDLIHQNAVGHLRAFPSTGDLTADNKLFTNSYIVGSGSTTTAFPRLF